MTTILQAGSLAQEHRLLGLGMALLLTALTLWLVHQQCELCQQVLLLVCFSSISLTEVRVYCTLLSQFQEVAVTLQGQTPVHLQLAAGS